MSIAGEIRAIAVILHDVGHHEDNEILVGLRALANRIEAVAGELSAPLNDTRCEFADSYNITRSKLAAWADELMGDGQASQDADSMEAVLSNTVSPKPARPCRHCEGNGWTVGVTSGHSPYCDCGEGDTTCPVPEQVQEQCSACSGVGQEPEESGADELADLASRRLVEVVELGELTRNWINASIQELESYADMDDAGEMTDDESEEGWGATEWRAIAAELRAILAAAEGGDDDTK